MARHSSALTSLCGCLRGMPPVDIDWTSVIGLANQTLTTPALIDFVHKYAAMLPEDVCTYIRHIHRRNVLRNNRLIAQLEEAVVAMNVHGITPILLKGASTLATSPEARRRRPRPRSTTSRTSSSRSCGRARSRASSTTARSSTASSSLRSRPG